HRVIECRLPFDFLEALCREDNRMPKGVALHLARQVPRQPCRLLATIREKQNFSPAVRVFTGFFTYEWLLEQLLACQSRKWLFAFGGEIHQFIAHRFGTYRAIFK